MRQTSVGRPPSMEDEAAQEHLTRNHRAVEELQIAMLNMQDRIDELEALVATLLP